ncbi:MAG: tetratricopeptide repeat protein [Alphaproteobacteria bacterium]
MKEPPGDPNPPLIGDAAALLRNAANHFNKREFRAAATISLRLVESNPDLGEAWHILGRIGVETSDFTSAVASLARAASLEPQNVAIRFSLAQTLDKAGQPDHALAAWRSWRLMTTSLRCELQQHCIKRARLNPPSPITKRRWPCLPTMSIAEMPSPAP